MTTAHGQDSDVQLDTYLPSGSVSHYSAKLGPNPAQESQRRVLQLDATYSEHNYFKIVDSGTTVGAFSIGPHDSGETLYLAVHRLCTQLAERFIDSRAESHDTFQIGPHDKISSLKQLWEVLYRRVPGSMQLSSEYILPEPHDYYGGRSARNVEWERDDDDEYGTVCATET